MRWQEKDRLAKVLKGASATAKPRVLGIAEVLVREQRAEKRVAPKRQRGAQHSWWQ